MGVPDQLFDEDYLYFYADRIGAERSDSDASAVVELLELRAGMRVLDVPCGEGRIAGRLATLGCEVVGVDASELFLELGRERYPNVRFERGDMRRLTFESEFDAALNWFTAFGYFDRAGNDAQLAGLARALRPGGRLVIELHNPAHLARIMELTGGSTATLVERDGDLMVDRITLDRLQGRSHTERFIVRDGRVRRLEFSLEQVPAAELAQRLRDAGFSSVRLLGRDGAPFDPEGPRLIALAER
jgi:SAM-dependent methyltransferase